MTHYTHIKDFPLYNWRECQEGHKEFTRRGEAGDPETDNAAWESIYDSFLEKFDIGRKFKLFHQKQQELTALYKEYAETGDRFLINDISVLEDELKSLSNGGEKYSIDDQIADVSKWMGGVIDENRTTVLQFYTLHARMVKDLTPKKPAR